MKLVKEEKKLRYKSWPLWVAVLVISSLLVFHGSIDISHAEVPKILSFQGRLTDASGNLLGSNGTNYYFKFDIYPSLTGGVSLWSSGGTAITIKVTQGVFNTLLGDTSAGYSALDLGFDSDSYYLRVQVSDTIDSGFETLSPRQRIVASGFAINAETVHGGRFLNASGVGQFGGLATASYSRFGTAETNHPGTINSSDDLLISGGLEVIGSATFDGTVRISQSASIYTEFYVDASGDIHMSAVGGNIRGDDENLFVCDGIGCGVSDPTDKGNAVIENSVIFGNKFRFKQIDASTVIMYDSIGSTTLEFDEGGGP